MSGGYRFAFDKMLLHTFVCLWPNALAHLWTPLTKCSHTHLLSAILCVHTELSTRCTSVHAVEPARSPPSDSGCFPDAVVVRSVPHWSATKQRLSDTTQGGNDNQKRVHDGWHSTKSLKSKLTGTNSSIFFIHTLKLTTIKHLLLPYEQRKCKERFNSHLQVTLQ